MLSPWSAATTAAARAFSCRSWRFCSAWIITRSVAGCPVSASDATETSRGGLGTRRAGTSEPPAPGVELAVPRVPARPLAQVQVLGTARVALARALHDAHRGHVELLHPRRRVAALGVVEPDQRAVDRVLLPAVVEVAAVG